MKILKITDLSLFIKIRIVGMYFAILEDGWSKKVCIRMERGEARNYVFPNNDRWGDVYSRVIALMGEKKLDIKKEEKEVSLTDKNTVNSNQKNMSEKNAKLYSRQIKIAVITSILTIVIGNGVFFLSRIPELLNFSIWGFPLPY